MARNNNQPADDHAEVTTLSADNLYSVTIKDKRFGERTLRFDFTDVSQERLIDYAVAHLRIRYKQSIVDAETAEWPAILDQPIMVKDIPAGRVRLTAQEKLVKDIAKLGLSKEDILKMLGM
jgi:hypothetical protein